MHIAGILLVHTSAYVDWDIDTMLQVTHVMVSYFILLICSISCSFPYILELRYILRYI